MSTSHKNGRTASKVLKVALSAALAAAFTPMAATPAFAATTPTEAETVAAIIKAAQDYKYQDANGNATYTYKGQSFVDGGTVLTGYTVEQYLNDNEDPKDDGAVLMYDMARFLGALNRGAQATDIQYAGAKYSWQPTLAGSAASPAVAELEGSNWVKEGSAEGNVTTLVSEIVKSLSASAGNTATVNLAVSTDGGKTYHNIALKSVVSTTQIYLGGKRVDGTFSLQSALQKAANKECDTIVMTSNAVAAASLELPAGVTLNGNGYSLTCLAGAGGGSTSAVISASGKDTVIQNLTIVGPNTKPATTDSEGAITRTDNMEYAIHASGSGTDLTLKGITISRAESAILASSGATVTIDGALNVSGNEYEAIELASSGKLVLSSKAAVTYADSADTPFVCSEGGAGIENKAAGIKLAKALTNSGEIHYYLSSAPANGAAYLYHADELSNSGKSVNLGGKTEYAMLKFTPKTSGTYSFASDGSVDAAAELYTMTGKGALGTKIASGDNEQGENFRVFAKLTGGSTYILRVGISGNAEEGAASGDINVAVSAAVADSMDSYVVALTGNGYYYDDEAYGVKTGSKNKLAYTVKSAIDGKSPNSDAYEASIVVVNAPDYTVGHTVDAADKPGRYALTLTAKADKGLVANTTTKCYFDVLDAKNIKDYNFTYNNTLVFTSEPIASLTNIAPKGYRYGSSTVIFNEADLAVAGWYSVDANGTEAKLAAAPSAVGNYVLKLQPADTTKYSNSSDPVELKFSITKGKVAPPTARTGLTYTGSAQVGVPTGASYTLSGTYSATNAGTYTAYATLAEGYSWSDGTTDPKTITWSIAKAKIAVPTGAANLTYTGKVQTGVAAGTGYTLSGTTTATEPGTYTCTATPSANYTWTDGTSTSKTVTWTLGKAPAGITATPSSVVVDEGTKAVVSLKQAGTAAYAVASSNSNVATATVSGSIVTITAKASGSATITVSTAATARYAAGTCTIAVSVPKAEGATGSAVDPTTKATNKFKVTTSADPDDPDVKPTVAFTGTSATGKFTIPATVTLADGVTYKVTSIASKAFDGEGVTQVTVPKGITKIGTYAFRDCTKLTKVTLPSTLKEIGSSAFSGCSKLTSVSVAGGKVGKNAFKNCKKLSSVTLGSKVTSVGASALKGAKATSITIKTSKLTKTSIKNLVKDSKITTIKCSGLSKTIKAKYSTWAKTYKWNVKVN